MKGKMCKPKQKALKAGILKKVKADTQIVAKIITDTKMSYPTVMRWINNNDIELTRAACLNAICEALKVQQSEILA